MKTPNDLLESAMMRVVHSRDRIMRARINGDLKLAKRAVWLIPVKLLVGIAVMVIFGLDGNHPVLHSLAIAPLALIFGWWPLATLDRQQAYSSGWREGRRLAFDSMFEARRRGLSMDDWLESELERDMRTPL